MKNNKNMGSCLVTATIQSKRMSMARCGVDISATFGFDQSDHNVLYTKG